MARALTFVTRRRVRGLLLAGLAAVIIATLVDMYYISLRRSEFFDGWILFTGVVFLSLFNMRKKLPMIPLGRAETWTQIHLYVGLLVVVVFFLHVGLSFPTGVLDWALWLIFLTVAVSGMVGLYLSRTIPAKLERSTEQILFERIPGFRAQLARDVEELAVKSVEEGASLTISTFYAETLHDYFDGPRNLFGHLRGSNRSLSRLVDEIEKLKRYLDDAGRDVMDEIKDHVIAKDNLDFRYVHIGALRLWLFVHIPATYSLLILGVTHVAAMYAFSSGAL